MEQEFRPDLKAHVTIDDDGTVRQILHTDERWLPVQGAPRRAAMEYVRAQSELFRIAQNALDRLHETVDYTNPRGEGASYRLSEEKRQFDGTTVAFA